MTDKKTEDTETTTDDETLTASVKVNCQETMLGDLMSCAVDEIKHMQKPWEEMSEGEQGLAIERIQLQMEAAVEQAVNIISSGGKVVVKAMVEQVVFKDGIKVVLKATKGNPAVHDIADAEGQQILIVIPDAEGYMGGDQPKADKDQKDLDMGEGDQDPLWVDAVGIVRDTKNASISELQRRLKVGYNRSARLIEEMERQGVISAVDDGGNRTVLYFEDAA